MDNFPRRYARELRRHFAREFGCLLVLLLFLGLGTWQYATWVSTDPTPMAVLALVVLGVPFCLLAVVLLLMLARFLRGGPRPAVACIIPYFDRHLGLGAQDAPASGEALARNCRALDELAAARGVEPLSGLGLDDDLGDESPRWRNPQAGLTTIRALLDGLDALPAPSGVAKADALRAELVKLESALVKAQQHGASFCLLLRIDRDTRVRPGGVDLSTGSFW